jgi:hypothetical protein
MNPHISTKELNALAAEHGLVIQHECGGYRVVRASDNDGRRDVFPNSGICPTVARLACYIFLLGVTYGRKL